jgi:hypothetical protein
MAAKLKLPYGHNKQTGRELFVQTSPTACSALICACATSIDLEQSPQKGHSTAVGDGIVIAIVLYAICPQMEIL